MRKLFYIALFAIIFFQTNIHAQTIQTVIGGSIGDAGAATNAELYAPVSVTADGAGNVYILDGNNERVRMVSASGVITTIAGNGFGGNTGDGSAAILANINTNSNGCIRLDKDGNICFSSTWAYCIRKVNKATGIITTIAGNDTAGYSGTGGPATAAKIGYVMGIAFDNIDNLYLTDELSSCIRKVDTFGNISLIAGVPLMPGYAGDGGPATAAQLNGTYGVAVDVAGNIYIADSYNACIRKVNTSGIISTIAGTGLTYGSSGDGGPATAALLDFPTDIVIDAFGNIYIADQGNYNIRKIDPSGIISTYAGSGFGAISGDGGPATAAGMYPGGIWIDASGNLYIADGNNRIRMVNTAGIINTIAGENGSVTDGGPAIDAEILNPSNSAVDNAGNIYIPDNGNNRVKRIIHTGTSIGNITTVAGNGIVGYSGDGGPATAAQLYNPTDVAFDPAGNMYIADAQNNRVRIVSTAGIINTFAGNGSIGFSGDGGLAVADTAALDKPWGMAADNAGNVYIADWGNNRVRKVNAAGIITTIAGNGNITYAGDGLADTAAVNPNDIIIDASGNLIIADWANSRIRKINLTTGIISTIVGNGVAGFSGDGGQADTAELNFPWAVKLDDTGNLYIDDLGNDRIRKVNTAGIITTVAGNGTIGFSGDGGPADAAKLNDPYGLCIDNLGNLFISDAGNDRIRGIGNDLSIKTLNKVDPVIDLFPNPAHNEVTVTITPFLQQKQGIIINILGQEVKRINITSGSQVLNINDLTSGVYLLQIIDNTTSQKTTKRFVKE